MSMHPLSPWVFLRRNMGKSIPLVAVIALAVVLIAAIVTLVNSIPYSVRETYAYARHQLALSPRNAFAVDDSVLQKVKTGPVPIERIISCRVIGTQVRSIVGKWPFVVVCLKPDDIYYFTKRLGGERIIGRMPEAGKPEVLISEPVSRNLNLKIGSVALSPTEKDSYSPKYVKVVGIAQTPEWFMASTYSYHEQYHFPPYDNLLVFARGGTENQEKLDRWVTDNLKGESVEVFAYHMLEKSTREMFSILYKILNVIIGTLVLVLAFLMGMLMNIYQSQRLVEFGLLQAIGYTRKRLLRRTLAESVIVIIVGWLVGVGLSSLLLRLVDRILMYPNAFALNVTDKAALLYTAIIPVAILFAAVMTVLARFRKFDPVAVVERRLA